MYYSVIVVDNASGDGSVEKIQQWAKANIGDGVLIDIGFTFYCTRSDILQIPACESFLSLVETAENGGFAAGNNVGIQYALQKGFDYLWLLNPDTVVEPKTLSRLVDKAMAYDSTEKVGIIGCKIRYYSNREKLQAVGGVYNKWLGVGKHVGSYETDMGQYDHDEICKKIDYVIGASMFVKKEFVLDVGSMCEDYFLYYEEVDWAWRGRKKGWTLGYCWKGIVYHKEGACIGSSSKGEEKSELADYFGLRNRIVFTKKHFPYCLPTVYIGFIVTMINRIRRGQTARLWRFIFGKPEFKRSESP